MIERRTQLAHPSNHGGTRPASAIKYIVVHYTANDGDNDQNNARYFQTEGRNASAHYFVDDDSITQSVPDLTVAWSVGGRLYSDAPRTGGGKLYGLAKNHNTLNIELCDTKKDGQIMATEKTLANAVELIQELMGKYGIPKSRVIRHFDVTGKKCPAYFVNKTAWAAFLARIKDKPDAEQKATDYTVTSAGLNLRSGPGTKFPAVFAMTKGDTFRVTSMSGTWAKGTTEKGLEGYAHARYLKKK